MPSATLTPFCHVMYHIRRSDMALGYGHLWGPEGHPSPVIESDSELNPCPSDT